MHSSPRDCTAACHESPFPRHPSPLLHGDSKPHPPMSQISAGTSPGHAARAPRAPPAHPGFPDSPPLASLQVFNLKTLLVKWFSCILAVSSGMPMGPEGPMIHMGAAVGAGVSRGRSRTLGWDHTGCADRLFRRLRNNRDHRDFIACGAAAGVAAISAPVGGMLFVLEEIASWYDLRLVARIFFCCMVASMSSMWLNGTFDGWRIDWSAPWALKHSIHYKEVRQGACRVFVPDPLLVEHWGGGGALGKLRSG